MKDKEFKLNLKLTTRQALLYNDGEEGISYTILKSGFVGMYLLIFETGWYDLKIDCYSKEQLLENFKSTNIEDLKLLDNEANKNT